MSAMYPDKTTYLAMTTLQVLPAKDRPWAALTRLASRPLPRPVRPFQAHQAGEQGVETGAVAGMQVDAADLLDQALDRLELLQPQEERVILHQLRGVEERARGRGLLLAADQV